MYQGIVFDLDHTLFDRYATYRAIGPRFYQVLRTYISPNLSQDEAVELWCRTDREKVHLGWSEMLRHGENIGLFHTAPSLEQYSSFIFPEFCKTAVPYPFTKPILTQLKQFGFKLGLITNGSPKIQHQKIALLSLESYFDEILVADGIMKKPLPKPFLQMASHLECLPQELFYVGDHPINDVEGARNAGYTPVWVKTTGIWIDTIERAKWEIDTIEQLPSLPPLRSKSRTKL